MTTTPKNKTPKVTEAELQETQDLSRMLLMIATQHPPHIAMTSLLMATNVAAVAANLPLEDFTVMQTKTTEEVYEAALTKGTLN